MNWRLAIGTPLAVFALVTNIAMGVVISAFAHDADRPMISICAAAGIIQIAAPDAKGTPVSSDILFIDDCPIFGGALAKAIATPPEVPTAVSFRHHRFVWAVAPTPTLDGVRNRPYQARSPPSFG